MIPEEFSRYIKSKEFKSLLSKYEQAISDDESVFLDSDDILDIAEYYHLKGQTDNSLRAAGYCHELYPDNEKALVFLSRSAIIEGDADRARAIAAMLETYDTVDACFLKIEIMLIDGETDKVETYLNEYYSELDEDDDRRMDVLLGISLLLLDYGCNDMAERWISLAMDAGLGDDIDIVEARARLMCTKGLYADAIPLWNRYLDSDAFSPNAWIMMAQCQYQTGLCHEALQSAEYALAIDANLPDALLAAGNALFALGRERESVDMFERYLDVIPSDPQGELLLATAFFVMEEYADARVHIENAINAVSHIVDDDIPDFVFQEIYKQAAYICGAQRDLKQALHYLDYLLFYGVGEVDVELLRASIYLEVGKLDDGFSILNSLITERQSDTDLYLRIGVMIVDASLYQLGYDMLSKVYDVLREHGTIERRGYDRYAYACFMLDKYDEFLEALKISAEQLPTETVTIFSVYFPSDLPVSDYYEYAKNNKLNNKQ